MEFEEVAISVDDALSLRSPESGASDRRLPKDTARKAVDPAGK